MSSNERPRRSTRVPTRTPAIIAPPTPATPLKRKTRDQATELEQLLTNPKSKLTTVDISDLINYENFLRLSPRSQRAVCSLLPASAFSTFQRSLHAAHPAGTTREPVQSQDNNSTATDSGCSPAMFDPAFFTNTFFLSAAHTFQDHLASGWRSRRETDKVNKYKEGVLTGSMHAQWKDEEWEQGHKPPKEVARNDLDLVALVQCGQLREGDIIVYQRRFVSPPVLVEKQLLVKSVHDKSSALNMLLPPQSDRALPPYLLPIAPPDPRPPILSMEGIMSSIALEEGILDVDGRVPQDARNTVQVPNLTNLRVDYSGISQDSRRASQAAKALSVWRWDEDRLPEVEVQSHLDKGGREYLGTVFFLRRA